MRKHTILALSVVLILSAGTNDARAEVLVRFDDLVVQQDQEADGKWCQELPSGMWKCCGYFEDEKVSTCKITWGESSP